MKATFKLSTIIIVISIMLSACVSAGGPPPGPQDIAPYIPITGVIFQMQSGSVLRGVQQALSEAVGTQIYSNGKFIITVWPLGQGWGFVGFDVRNQVYMKTVNSLLTGGQFVNAQTIKDLTTYLEKYGWKAITAAEVPELVKVAATNTASWLAGVSAIMPTFALFPGVGVDIYCESIGGEIGVDPCASEPVDMDT